MITWLTWVPPPGKVQIMSHLKKFLYAFDTFEDFIRLPTMHDHTELSKFINESRPTRLFHTFHTHVFTLGDDFLFADCVLLNLFREKTGNGLKEKNYLRKFHWNIICRHLGYCKFILKIYLHDFHQVVGLSFGTLNHSGL